LVRAHHDMQDVRNYLDAFAELDALQIQENTYRYYYHCEAILIAAVVAYCRPFTKSVSRGAATTHLKPTSLICIAKSPANLALHKLLLERRNKMMAHSDWTYHHTQLLSVEGASTFRRSSVPSYGQEIDIGAFKSLVEAVQQEAQAKSHAIDTRSRGNNATQGGSHTGTESQKMNYPRKQATILALLAASTLAHAKENGWWKEEGFALYDTEQMLVQQRNALHAKIKFIAKDIGLSPAQFREQVDFLEALNGFLTELLTKIQGFNYALSMAKFAGAENRPLVVYQLQFQCNEMGLVKVDRLRPLAAQMTKEKPAFAAEIERSLAAYDRAAESVESVCAKIKQ